MGLRFTLESPTPEQQKFLNSLSEFDIQRLVYSGFIEKVGRYDFAMPNCYSHADNECDVMGIRKSGYYDEFEIKVSRSDFLADKNKTVYCPNPDHVPYGKRTKEQQELLLNTKDWRSIPFHPQKIKKPKCHAIKGGLMANYFWYVTPLGLVEKSEIPDYAGWLEVDVNGRIKESKNAPKMHSSKLTDEQKYKIARKACFRIWK